MASASAGSTTSQASDASSFPQWPLATGQKVALRTGGSLRQRLELLLPPMSGWRQSTTFGRLLAGSAVHFVPSLYPCWSGHYTEQKLKKTRNDLFCCRWSNSVQRSPKIKLAVADAGCDNAVERRLQGMPNGDYLMIRDRCAANRPKAEQRSVTATAELATEAMSKIDRIRYPHQQQQAKIATAFQSYGTKKTEKSTT